MRLKHVLLAAAAILGISSGSAQQKLYIHQQNHAGYGLFTTGLDSIHFSADGEITS